MPNLLSFLTSNVCSELRLLPSAGITQHPRYYKPLRHPIAPSLSVAGVWLVFTLRPREGLPVLLRSSFVCMLLPLPRRKSRVHFPLSSPGTGSLPRFSGGSASALRFSRPAQRSLHVTACILAKSLNDPLHRRLQPFRCLHDCFDCYRLERKLPDGIRTH